MTRSRTVPRRDWLRLSTAGLVTASASSATWLQALADGAADAPPIRRCILLWMSGGPSQTDTFDLKTGHPNGGPFQPIRTSADGLQISEHLPKLAQQMHHAAVVRSMKTREGDHQRATFLARTGRVPQGPIQYPPLGAVAAKEHGGPTDLPHFVSINPTTFLSPAAFTSGYLGPNYTPLLVGGSYDGESRVRNLESSGGAPQFGRRWEMLQRMQREFSEQRPDLAVASHQSAYRRGVEMMQGQARAAFDVSQEDGRLRDAYGRNQFGQGCLLARRLVERGVPFVEVTLNGWDTHQSNFTETRQLCEILDPAFATLMADLTQRGLLESTVVVWMGEFGRTPRINPSDGRDHFPAAWSAVLAGGGIRGGQCVGRTSDDGTSVEERPVSISELLATICHAVGLDPGRQNMSNVGRPIRVIDPGVEPVREALL